MFCSVLEFREKSGLSRKLREVMRTFSRKKVYERRLGYYGPDSKKNMVTMAHTFDTATPSLVNFRTNVIFGEKTLKIGGTATGDSSVPSKKQQRQLVRWCDR